MSPFLDQILNNHEKEEDALNSELIKRFKRNLLEEMKSDMLNFLTYLADSTNKIEYIRNRKKFGRDQSPFYQGSLLSELELVWLHIVDRRDDNAKYLYGSFLANLPLTITENNRTTDLKTEVIYSISKNDLVKGSNEDKLIELAETTVQNREPYIPIIKLIDDEQKELIASVSKMENFSNYEQDQIMLGMLTLERLGL
jgi:hypothetical protein